MAVGIEGSFGARAHELLDLAASGDRDAFDVLIRPRLDRLYRMAVAITRSEADARDATQDACVLAWRELPRLRDREKFDAWLSQILVNAARGVVRRTGRRRVRELSVDADPEGAGSRAEPSVTAETDTFADTDAIQRAFDALDGTTRALLVLHYVEGTPLAEIARATGSPVGTVKWRLSNARRALERALEAERR
ncbi:MAG: RNA polymerase sigma factor [Chloroflexota bacterium]